MQRPVNVSFKGFTLAELLVVLFILAVVTTLLVPSLYQSSRSYIRTEAVRFYNVLRFIADEGTYAGKQYRLVYEPELQRYSVKDASADPDAVEQPVLPSLLQPRTVPKDRGKLTWVHRDERAFSLTREIEIPFGLHGPVLPVLVQFQQGDEQGFSVLYRPQDGQPRILEGLVDWDGI